MTTWLVSTLASNFRGFFLYPPVAVRGLENVVRPGTRCAASYDWILGLNGIGPSGIRSELSGHRGSLCLSVAPY